MTEDFPVPTDREIVDAMEKMGTWHRNQMPYQKMSNGTWTYWKAGNEGDRVPGFPSLRAAVDHWIKDREVKP